MQPALDPCFAGDTVEAILDALAAEAASGSAHSGWAAETRAGFRARPPPDPTAVTSVNGRNGDICIWWTQAKTGLTATHPGGEPRAIDHC